MFANVNNVSLFYQVSGNGTPLILLHGNGEDHHIFDKMTKKLENHCRVYSVDSRNHGESEKTDDYSYLTMSEDIYHFIKRMDADKIDLLGFSDGGIIGLMLATRHKEVINKMVLAGVNLKPEDFTEENYDSIMKDYAKTKDPLLKLMLEQPGIELDDIKHVDIPTLVVGAENDLFKPETFCNIAKALPNSRLKIMSGHRHDSYVIGQDILFPYIKEFFFAP